VNVDLLVFALTGVPGGLVVGTATVMWWRTRRITVQTDGRSGWSRFWDDAFGTSPAPAAAAPPSAPDPVPETPPAPVRDETLEMASSQRIPAKCREKAAEVIASIETLRARMAGRSDTDPLRVEVEAIRSRHLSEALHKYADIPEEHRAEFFRRTGKSASFHLAETIDVMAKRLEEISRTLAAEKLDSFANSNRFIDTQYGDNDPFRVR
jgi:hypothetical protein